MQQSLGGVMQQPSVSFGGLASSSQPQGSIFAGMQGMPGLQSLVGNLDQNALVPARPAPAKRFATDPSAADAAIELQSTSHALSQQLQVMDTLARSLQPLVEVSPALLRVTQEWPALVTQLNTQSEAIKNIAVTHGTQIKQLSENLTGHNNDIQKISQELQDMKQNKTGWPQELSSCCFYLCWCCVVRGEQRRHHRIQSSSASRALAPCAEAIQGGRRQGREEVDRRCWYDSRISLV